jgi:hypothetical protein
MAYKGDDSLSYAITYNEDHHQSPVARLLLEIEGDNDGPSWHWIVQLEDGRFAYGWGGCDYTGWDCQSSIHWKDSRATIEEAIADAPPQDSDNINVNETFKEMYAKSNFIGEAAGQDLGVGSGAGSGEAGTGLS